MFQFRATVALGLTETETSLGIAPLDTWEGTKAFVLGPKIFNNKFMILFSLKQY